MTSVRPLPTRFCLLKRGHEPTEAYLKQFGHQDDNKCGWRRGSVSQPWEHLFRHCIRWRDPQRALWEAVEKATGWKAGRCRHMQMSELFSIAECDQVLMNFLATTEIRKFPPN